jgi:hypothetical protein
MISEEAAKLFMQAVSFLTMTTTREKTLTKARASTLINRRRVRKFILDFASKNRYHKFSGVKSATLDRIEGELRNFCARFVAGAPSKGKRL